jgi:hypothetical protein
VVILVVIAVRILYVFPTTYLPRLLFPRIHTRDPSPPWQMPAIISWAGMRGVVSLAAALAIPLAVDGVAFPDRDLILFLTFTVIVATLVVQGLTLPWVARWLRVTGWSDDWLSRLPRTGQRLTWVCRNRCHVMWSRRTGAGGIPARRRNRRIVETPTRYPSRNNSPQIGMQPHPGCRGPCARPAP